MWFFLCVVVSVFLATDAPGRGVISSAQMRLWCVRSVCVFGHTLCATATATATDFAICPERTQRVDEINGLHDGMTRHTDYGLAHLCARARLNVWGAVASVRR